MPATQLSMYVDPNNRAWAAVTSDGSQSTFLNSGDMYEMALRYASYATGGAITYSKNGKVFVPPAVWNSKVQHAAVSKAA